MTEIEKVAEETMAKFKNSNTSQTFSIKAEFDYDTADKFIRDMIEKGFSIDAKNEDNEWTINGIK